MQKGRGITNITGEKLYESHVIEALARASERHGVQARFHLMLADVEGQGYRLYLEPDAALEIVEGFAESLDQALAVLNEEYLAKRQSGRLNALQVCLLKAGAGEAYRAHCVGMGQSEAQFKTVTLQYAHLCGFPFQNHLR